MTLKSILSHLPIYHLARGAGALLMATLITAAMLLWPTLAFGAGTLAPAGNNPPLQIINHTVDVHIDNGFARTNVVQTFANPHTQDMEAVYTFPAPANATLADVAITSGDTILTGEVIAKQQARDAYADEAHSEDGAGLAEKDGYRQFRFHVYPVRAGQQVEVSFAYYQPLEIDAGVGRYVYPLEEGDADAAAGDGFWARNTRVDGALSIRADIRNSYPIMDIRAPGTAGMGRGERLADGHWRFEYRNDTAALERDFVLYYRLADNLPGRVEVVTYKPSPTDPGTFMLTLTPGMDLAPLEEGADFCFILDTSGSMRNRFAPLREGVRQSLGKLRPQDRFRLITFSTEADDFTGWKPATAENVERALRKLDNIKPGGSTNLEAGIMMALRGLDADRVQSVVLVTDGVANTGNASPEHFHKLLQQYDLRLFGFLVGNSTNFPLMEALCDATGGTYTNVSNQDEIAGQLLLARNKVTHEALLDVDVALLGGAVRFGDLRGRPTKKIFRGQQVVIFGQYAGSGPATVRLTARLAGERRVIDVPVTFPASDTRTPEIERMWALQSVRDVEFARDIGQMDSGAAADAIRDLGVTYQLVTDETSMAILSDAGHRRQGIVRSNEARVATEQAAQAQRAQQAPQSNVQVQGGNMGGGGGSLVGGAIDPLTGVLGALGIVTSLLLGRKKKAKAEE